MSIPVLTPEEMQRADGYTIQQRGIPSLVLMERAAHSVVRAILEECSGEVPRSALVVCGQANNGGDGLTVARELDDLGCDVEVWLPLGVANLSENATFQLGVLAKSDVRLHVSPSFPPSPCSPDVVVDALFGTGLSRPLSPALDDVLESMNRCMGLKVAVDIPSGVGGKTGRLWGKNPFRADLTVSFAFPKTGLLLFPGRDFVGKLRVAYIGISPQAPSQAGVSPRFLVNESYAKSLLPLRERSGHKGSFGKVAILGGSARYPGAPLLSVQGAFAGGCGMVHLLVPGEALRNVPFSVPAETIVHRVPGTKGVHSGAVLEAYRKTLEGMDVLVMGPGMGREGETVQLVHALCTEWKGPLVLDADALFALASIPESLQTLSKRTIPAILTPHAGEFARFFEQPLPELPGMRLEELVAFSKKFHCITVHKGATTLVANTDGELAFHLVGNDGLATAGSGDVLAGLVGGLAAQCPLGFHAANLGVYVHGTASQLYAQENWKGSLTPSELLRWIPRAFPSG